jgi:hypothetical protein
MPHGSVRTDIRDGKTPANTGNLNAREVQMYQHALFPPRHENVPRLGTL